MYLLLVLTCSHAFTEHTTRVTCSLVVAYRLRPFPLLQSVVQRTSWPACLCPREGVFQG